MIKKHLSSALLSGLAYGLGLVLGEMVSYWIFNNVSMDLIRTSQRLVIGIFLAFLIMAIGGAISGFIGGLTLDVGNRPRGKFGYAWRSALTFAIANGLLLFPVGLVISLLAFYNISKITPTLFAAVFIVIGAIYGFLSVYYWDS